MFGLAQLPRPKWMAAGSPFSSAAFNSPAGILLRRFSLAYQGALIFRQAQAYLSPKLPAASKSARRSRGSLFLC